MKTTLLTASATLAVGLAAGWMLKPDPATTARETDPDPARAASPALAKLERRAPSPDEAEAPTRIGPQERAQAQRAAVALRNRKAEARKYRLTEALGLDAGQQAQLDEIARSGAGQAEQALRGILRDDQRQRLDAFKARDEQSRLDAFARNRMSQLDQVDLDAEQREAVAQRFRDLGRGELDGDSWNPFHPKPIGGSDYEEVFQDPDLVAEPDQIPDRLEEIHDEQNAETIYTIDDLLTPAQKEQLRTQFDALADHRLEIFTGTTNRNPDYMAPRQPRPYEKPE